MTTPKERDLIRRIAERAAQIYQRSTGAAQSIPFIRTELTFVHEEVCPLRLQDLAEADDFNLIHDVVGIHRHLKVGEKAAALADGFTPRFAVQQ